MSDGFDMASRGCGSEVWAESPEFEAILSARQHTIKNRKRPLGTAITGEDRPLIGTDRRLSTRLQLGLIHDRAGSNGASGPAAGFAVVSPVLNKPVSIKTVQNGAPAGTSVPGEGRSAEPGWPTSRAGGSKWPGSGPAG